MSSFSNMYVGNISHLPLFGAFVQPVVSHPHTHVRYTSAHPFTPEFVQGHLKKGNKSNASRVRALYDERVRRRQVGLVERKNNNSTQTPSSREKRKINAGKEDAARVRKERMGRREAAEKGVWRLRADEARYEIASSFHSFFRL
jgi:ribonuclease P protein subunit POP4